MTNSSQDKTICNIDNSTVDTSNINVSNALEYVTNDNGNVDNMYKAMVLSPAVIKPIHDLYLAVLHDQDSPLDDWVSELLSVQVAMFNQCSYALAHHSANLETHINDSAKYKKIIKALEKRNWGDVMEDKKLVAMLDYGEKLCLHPDQINESDIEVLRSHGFSEKEIVFIAQINAGFAYWTRILNALGVKVAGEPIGLQAKAQQ